MGYRDELQEIAEYGDSFFPSFLFNPVFNDFGEDYYSLGVSEDPLVVKARSLRKKYANYFEYLDALNTYHEYMDLLLDKYGSMQLIKNNYKLGLMDDIIPTKPRPKMSNKNKEFIRMKMLPSRKIGDSDYSDVINESERLFPQTEDVNHIEELDQFKKPNKNIRKALNRASSKLSQNMRRKSLYSNAGNNHGADVVIEYLNQLTKGTYTSDGKYKETSIMQIYKEEERVKGIPPELLEDELSRSMTIMMNGQLVKKSEYDKIGIIKAFYEAGYDVTGTMTKNMNKHAVRMIRQSIGAMDSEPMTKKELKKWKKRAKEEKGKLVRQKDNDSALSDVLLRNKIDFGRNGSSLNFRLKDIYTNDD